MSSELIIGTVALIGFLVVFKFLISQLEEIDTAMQIRKGLVEAKKIHEEKYGFRARVDEVGECNMEGVLDFTQFRGRL